MGDSLPPPAAIDLVGSYARTRGGDVELVLSDPQFDAGDAEVRLTLAKGSHTADARGHVGDGPTGRRLAARVPRSQLSDGTWTITARTGMDTEHTVEARLLVQGARPLVLLWGAKGSRTQVPASRTAGTPGQRVTAAAGKALDRAVDLVPPDTAKKFARSPFVERVLPPGSERRAKVGSAVRRYAPGALPARKKAAKKSARKATAPLTEEQKLKRIWSTYKADMLGLYLVTGYQDPRLNAQSILARHTLVRALFGDEFDDLMREELQRAALLNDTIRRRSDELGVSLVATMDTDKHTGIAAVMESVADSAPVFAQKWRAALEGRTAPKKLRVVEFACGSANDYRAMADYGIAAFLDYTGIDLNDTNIANAKHWFPDVDFRVDSILSLDLPARSVDYVIGFDILEHLSLKGMYTALETAHRLVRMGLYFALFRADEHAEHEEHPRGQYHYNLLSVPQLRRELSEQYEEVELVMITKMMNDEYGYPHSGLYNRRAYSLITSGPRD